MTNINSYDQMGVELGKRLAKTIKPMLENPDSEGAKKRAQELDSSTRYLLNKVLSR